MKEAAGKTQKAVGDMKDKARDRDAERRG